MEARSSTIQRLGSWWRVWGGKMLQELSLMAQTVSCNVYTPHYVPCVNIERNNNYCLIGCVSFCRPCFTPTNKGSRNCSVGDNANNNRSTKAQKPSFMHALRELGEVLVAILGRRPCRVFTLNTNWGQYYNEDFISILGKVEAKCGCWK